MAELKLRSCGSGVPKGLRILSGCSGSPNEFASSIYACLSCRLCLPGTRWRYYDTSLEADTSDSSLCLRHRPYVSANAGQSSDLWICTSYSNVNNFLERQVLPQLSCYHTF
jgi:hypothetical protein